MMQPAPDIAEMRANGFREMLGGNASPNALVGSMLLYVISPNKYISKKIRGKHVLLFRHFLWNHVIETLKGRLPSYKDIGTAICGAVGLMLDEMKS